MITNDISLIMERVKVANEDSRIAVWVDNAKEGTFKAAFHSTVVSLRDAKKPTFIGAFSKKDKKSDVSRIINKAMKEARRNLI